MSKFSSSDLSRLSWDEYGQELEALYSKISQYLQKENLTIDAVVPILRGAATAGSYLAYKLHVLKVLPIQYKYLDSQLQQLDQLLDSAFKFVENPTFLVVENNHVTGASAKKTIARIKSISPNCKIIYAAVHVDYSYQDMTQIEVMFYSHLSNESRKLTGQEAQEKGLIQQISLFPWENEAEELAAFNKEKFEYQG